MHKRPVAAMRGAGALGHTALQGALQRLGTLRNHGAPQGMTELINGLPPPILSSPRPIPGLSLAYRCERQAYPWLIVAKDRLIT